MRRSTRLLSRLRAAPSAAARAAAVAAPQELRGQAAAAAGWRAATDRQFVPARGFASQSKPGEGGEAAGAASAAGVSADGEEDGQAMPSVDDLLAELAVKEAALEDTVKEVCPPPPPAHQR